MKKIIILSTLFFTSYNASNAQILNKVKDKAKKTITTKTTSDKSEEKSNNSSSSSSNSSKSTNNYSYLKSNSSEEETKSYITEKELAENLYADEDRWLKTANGEALVKKLYKKGFTDDINFSGTYYLNSFLMIAPSSHFSSEKPKFFGGFSLNYNPEKHTMQVHFSEEDSNFAIVPEQYQKSADKGNVTFQFGMQGGPEELFNVNCLVLEPGVILLGAEVYHKNDEVGHQWMNNITPQSFVIAAKDTAKFKEYQANPEYTSKVVFEKFDALRKVWKQGEIEEAKPLPAEGMKDASLKSDALALIKRTAEGYKWKESVEYAYVTSSDWEIKKHPLTGFPLKRIAKCIVVMKTPQGDFKREGFYIAQDYDGSAYGKSYMLYNDQRIYYVKPAEAMKYK